MEKEMPFSSKKMVLTGLREIEERLLQECKRIVAYTSIYSPHVMRMFKKVGYEPFFMSLKDNVIWFRKELFNVR
jgi:hypothetical protein